MGGYDDVRGENQENYWACFRGNETLTRAQAAKLIYTTIYN